MFALSALPATLLGLGMLSCPETPAWLQLRGRHEAAEETALQARPGGGGGSTAARPCSALAVACCVALAAWRHSPWPRANGQLVSLVFPNIFPTYPH